MSASLVGSEMCIRDSRRPVRRPGAGDTPGASRGTHRSSPVTADPDPPDTCLLYTSDAADDM
eukprot:14606866-Alexandrium_andersonii.AAC.1